MCFSLLVWPLVNLKKKKRLFMMILTKLLWKLLCLVCFSQISIYALTPFWFSFNEALLDPENRTRNIPPIHIYNARVPRVAPHWMNVTRIRCRSQLTLRILGTLRESSTQLQTRRPDGFGYSGHLTSSQKQNRKHG